MTYYPWRQAIGKRGESNRRVVDRNGRPYHVTKGWRGHEPRSDVAEAIAAMQADMAKVNARFEELKSDDGRHSISLKEMKSRLSEDDRADIDRRTAELIADLEAAREKIHASLERHGIADMPVPSDDELRAMQARGELRSDEELAARRQRRTKTWPSPKDLIAPDENDAPDIAKIRAWEDALDTPYVDMVFDGVTEPTLPRTIDASDAEIALDDATAHLLASPANAARLMESIEQVRRGETTERELLPSLQFDDIDFSLEPLPIASDPIVEAIAHWSVYDYLQARSVVKTLGAHTLSADELGRLMALRSMVAVYEDDHGILSE